MASLEGSITTDARGRVARHELGTIDFARGRLTWCKDNPASASDVHEALAFVRLARECTAARGPVFGSGYLIEPRG
jgi:hypothetical protein